MPIKLKGRKEVKQPVRGTGRAVEVNHGRKVFRTTDKNDHYKGEGQMKKLMAFLKDEDGLELSEYAVMGALIIAVTVAVVTSLGDAIAARLGAITTAITPTP